MRIGEVAARAGVSAKTLRFYEDVGLLPAPGRTRSGYRDYTDGAVDRVVFIKQAQASGFTLEQIRQVLAIRDDGRPPCLHVAALVDERLHEVEARLQDLRATRDRLRQLAVRAETVDPERCGGFCDIIESDAEQGRSSGSRRRSRRPSHRAR